MIEGWRGIHHSYALVAQWHCLCILEHDDVELRFVDLPLVSKVWKATPGIFAPEQEEALAKLHAPEPSFVPEATFSMRPQRLDFRAPPSGRKFLFGTAENRVLTEFNRGRWRSGAEVPDTVSVVTPSRWAALAFKRFGLPQERIHVVPHGVDPTVLCPDEASRRTMRSRFGLNNHFVYMAVGAMTWNKGIDLLVAAFARVIETEPNVRLVLKGADGLYPSREFVRRILTDLPAREREAVCARLVYEGSTLSQQGIAHLLRAADCYVSPYRAEGFNMPVLEAAACGVPLICTTGSPTDEFTDPAFARQIRSTFIQTELSDTESGDALEPDLDHLVELMREASHDRAGTIAAGARAAAYAAERFSWPAVTDVLLAQLFPGASAVAEHRRTASQ